MDHTFLQWQQHSVKLQKKFKDDQEFEKVIDWFLLSGRHQLSLRENIVVST